MFNVALIIITVDCLIWQFYDTIIWIEITAHHQSDLLNISLIVTIFIKQLLELGAQGHHSRVTI